MCTTLVARELNDVKWVQFTPYHCVLTSSNDYKNKLKRLLTLFFTIDFSDNYCIET